MTTATQTAVKVARYRDAIGTLSDAFASLRSAANDAERNREAEWVRRAARELMGMACSRATERDVLRAERLIDQTADYLLAAGI